MPLLLFPPYALTLQTSKQPPKAPRRQAAARMWSAARNASPLVPGRGMPQAIKQMLQSQQLHAQLLQRHMTQPQVVHPQQLHLQLPQLSQRQMTQLHISQPQGCHSQWPQTQMLQSHAQTLQCQLQMLQSQTQTPQAYAQMLQSQTQTPQTYAQMLQSQTQTPQTCAQMLQSQTQTPQAYAQMLQSQTQTPQTYAQMLQSQTQTPQTYAQMLQSQTQTPQTYAQMLQSQTQTPQTCAQMLQSQTQTPQTYAQMLQFQTQTPQTYAQMLQSQTQTPQTCAQMLQSQTQTPQTYAQMLQSHMHYIESCRTLPNMTQTGGQVVPSQRLQQLLALMSVPDQGQGQYELAPYASARQGPFVADQSGTGFLYTSSHPPQLVTPHPHVDAAGQLQCQAFAQPPTLILDQHESACQPAHPPQQSKTVDSHFLQELFATADQQLMMLCQLSAPIQSADDLLFRLNSMGSDGINAEQVAKSKDVGSGSSACQGHVDSHSAPSEAQMVQLLQSSAKDIAELLQTLSAPIRLSKAGLGKSSILDGTASPTLPALKVSFTVWTLCHWFMHSFTPPSPPPPPPPAPGQVCTLFTLVWSELFLATFVIAQGKLAVHYPLHI